MLADLHADVKKLQDSEKGKFLARFFKTGKGDYGEGDIFYGLTVPQSRRIAVKYKDLPLSDSKALLKSPIHEERLIALLILVYQFQKGDEKRQKEVYDFYLSQTKYINNWDLVDLSADKIVGDYLYKSCHAEFISASSQTQVRFVRSIKEKKILKQVQDDNLKSLVKLAHSDNLWEKRIAMISTYAFIKNGKSEIAFTISDILLHDKHDLIQKAVGWMLREVGKRVSVEEEETFLKTRYQTMPRTMLRYAIERFPEEKRRKYLLGKI